MKIKNFKSRPGSLRGFLAVNYAEFTLLILAIAAAGSLGASLYLNKKAPVPDAEAFFEEGARKGDEGFESLDVEKYLGSGAGASLFDPDGRLAAQAGAEGELPENEALDCIPDYDSNTRILAAELPGEGLTEEEGKGGWLVTRVAYGEAGEPFVSGYALFDRNLRRTEGSLLEDREKLTEAELRYLQGKDSQGRDIYSRTYTDRQGRERQLVFFMPQWRFEAYVQAYEVLDQARWLFLPAYAAAAFFCIRQFGKKTGKLLTPLNTAIRNYSSGLPSGLEAYEGPREFEELADNFVQMEKRLQESEEERRRLDEEKRRLLADVSHDLKTPLTVIQGYADALREGMVPEKDREMYLKVISQRTRRVNELLLSFHEYSKLDHPQVPVRLRREDICQAVREYIAGRWGEIELAGFEAEADIPDEPIFCDLDGALFCRALENIINNAMKYNPPGTRILIRVEKAELRVRVRVGDNGMGIPDDLKDRLFLPFATGDSARGGGHGSGLGLAISRRIAELHGGSIRLADPPSPGLSAEFVFDFPLGQSEE